MAATPLAAAPRWRLARPDWAGAALAAALVMAVALPRSAHSPELDAQRIQDLGFQALAQRESVRLAAMKPSGEAGSGPALRLLASSRPARFIDEATRQRAMEFVRQQSSTGFGDG